MGEMRRWVSAKSRRVKSKKPGALFPHSAAGHPTAFGRRAATRGSGSGGAVRGVVLHDARSLAEKTPPANGRPCTPDRPPATVSLPRAIPRKPYTKIAKVAKSGAALLCFLGDLGVKTITCPAYTRSSLSGYVPHALACATYRLSSCASTATSCGWMKNSSWCAIFCSCP